MVPRFTASRNLRISRSSIEEKSLQILPTNRADTATYWVGILTFKSGASEILARLKNTPFLTNRDTFARNRAAANRTSAARQTTPIVGGKKHVPTLGNYYRDPGWFLGGPNCEGLWHGNSDRSAGWHCWVGHRRLALRFARTSQLRFVGATRYGHSWRNRFVADCQSDQKGLNTNLWSAGDSTGERAPHSCRDFSSPVFRSHPPRLRFRISPGRPESPSGLRHKSTADDQDPR